MEEKNNIYDFPKKYEVFQKSSTNIDCIEDIKDRLSILSSFACSALWEIETCKVNVKNVISGIENLNKFIEKIKDEYYENNIMR